MCVSRGVACTVAGTVLLLACAPRARPPIELPGCYAMEYGAWSHPVAPPPPPAHIALDTVKPVGALIGWAVNPHRVRPNILQTRAEVPAVWFVDARHVVHIRWSTGYSGYQLEMTQQDQGELVGRMDALSDDHWPGEDKRTATVRGRRIDCASAGIPESHGGQR